jgi:protein involved in polysaccharide export with SLBB domain
VIDTSRTGHRSAPHNYVMKSSLAFVFFVSLSLHCGLAQSGQQNLGEAKTSQRELRTTQAVPASYKIGVGDVIAITVYQEEDLSCSARVAEGGLIPFPLVGNILISGMSVSEATSVITARLRDGYLVNPLVSISLIEQSKATFTILGQVLRPGPVVMPANGSTTLLEAVGMAGGFTRMASPNRITVKRKSGEVVKVSAKEQAAEGNGRVFVVSPGDVITVPESIF